MIAGRLTTHQNSSISKVRFECKLQLMEKRVGEGRNLESRMGQDRRVERKELEREVTMFRIHCIKFTKN